MRLLFVFIEIQNDMYMNNCCVFLSEFKLQIWDTISLIMKGKTFALCCLSNSPNLTLES